MEKNNETGIRRLVWLPKEIDLIAEEARKKLGMKKSAFYRYTIIHFLQEMGVLSEKVKEELPNAFGQ